MKLGNLCSTTKRVAAFSLFEAVAVAAAVAVVGGVALAAAHNARKSTEFAKLEQDVRRINTAIRIYQSNGGTFDRLKWANLDAADTANPTLTLTNAQTLAVLGITPGDFAILKLKMSTHDDDAERRVGFAGRMIDPRLVPVQMTGDEEMTSNPRAAWNAATTKFEIKTSGPGIKKFVLDKEEVSDQMAGYHELFLRLLKEHREEGAVEYAATSDWVWDFDEVASAASTTPTDIDLDTPFVPGPPSGPPTAPTVLSQPLFSIPGGTFPLLTFDKTLTLTNPNLAALAQSRIMYSTVPGVWMEYTAPLTVTPGKAIKAYVQSLNPSDWTNSVAINHTYEATPISPAIALVLPAAATYAELGGAMEPGGPPPVLATGLASLTNAAAFPAQYLNSSTFGLYWTYDGNDPGDPYYFLNAPPASGPDGMYAGDPFTGTFPAQSIPVDFTRWTNGAGSLQVNLVALSYNLDAVQTSSTYSQSVGILRSTLRPPLTSISGADVTLSLETSFGDMPAGSRIYYTVDGTFPAESNGLPTSGYPYTGTFDVTGVGNSGCGEYTVIARAYPPASATDWFDVSASASVIVEVPPDPGTAQEAAYLYSRSSLANYSLVAAAGEGNIEFKDEAMIGGDIAIGPGVKRKIEALTLDGAYDVDPTTEVDKDFVYDTNGNPVTPNVVDLSATITDATSLNAMFAALTPTQTIVELKADKFNITVNGTASDGMNIIDTEKVEIKKGNLILNGGPDAWFIINVEKEIKFDDGGVTLVGGVIPSHVIFNSWLDKPVQLKGDRAVQGSILAPNSQVSVADDAGVDGTLVVGKDSTIEKVGFIAGSGNQFAFECGDGAGGGSSLPTSPLGVPIFSLVGGEYPNNDYDLSLTLTNPNSAGSSDLEYRVNGGGWQPYTGTPITVTPDDTISAYAKSTDTGQWTDSTVAANTYTAGLDQLVAPIITLSAEKFDFVTDPTVTVTITNPNPTALGSLMRRVDGGAWVPNPVPGSPIVFNLNIINYISSTALIEAKVISTNPLWLDSEVSMDFILSSLPVPLAKPLITLTPEITTGPNGTTVSFDDPNLPGISDILFVLVPVPSALGCDLIHGVAPPPGTYTTYSGPIEVPDSAYPNGFAVIGYSKALLPGYLDSETVVAYDESDLEGLRGGHFDVDTTGRMTYGSVWANWVPDGGGGSTNKHTHEYDNKYDTVVIDFFNTGGGDHAGVSDNVGAGEHFKIIIVNADLSPMAHLAINEDPSYSAPYVGVYDDVPFDSLPVYTLDGAPGTTQLTQLSLVFDEDAIVNAGLIPSNTGDVKGNEPGRDGEWRNGALTLQVVKVNPDGSAIAPLDPSISNGNHGVAPAPTMLHELTVFWHWPGDSYHENDYVPADQSTIVGELDASEEPLCN